jgi:hypothetical protein
MAATKKGSKAKKPFKISSPGALTRAQKTGETMVQTAQRLKKEGTPAQKKRANFYLNVLRPAAKKRKKKS